MSRIVLNLLILFHLTAIVFWSLPPPASATRPLAGHYGALREAVNRRTSAYILLTGLWQSWDMFSPNPLSLNCDVEADVTMRDGRTAAWIFPRMNELGLAQRYQMERWRKWREHVRCDDYRSIWADTARSVARRFNDATNPPVKVTLTRYWMELPPAQSPMTPVCAYYPRTNHYQFYDYVVQPGDLL